MLLGGSASPSHTAAPTVAAFTLRVYPPSAAKARLSPRKRSTLAQNDTSLSTTSAIDPWQTTRQRETRQLLSRHRPLKSRSWTASRQATESGKACTCVKGSETPNIHTAPPNRMLHRLQARVRTTLW